MAEQLIQTPKMPSGYEASQGLQEKAIIDKDILPWLADPRELAVSECTLQSGKTFLLASAIGTNPKLIEAAKSMTSGQRQNTDNMFYSRIPAIVSNGYSPNIESMPSPVTDFPILVMRNNGGQRVYFARVNLGLSKEQTDSPTILRLAVCDKNRQSVVISVLSGLSDRQSHRKLSK
jgi:hypothetical protein